jgi:hypothetical protein
MDRTTIFCRKELEKVIITHLDVDGKQRKFFCGRFFYGRYCIIFLFICFKIFKEINFMCFLCFNWQPIILALTVISVGFRDMVYNRLLFMLSGSK